MATQTRRTALSLVFLTLILSPAAKGSENERRKAKSDKIFETLMGTPTIFFMGRMITPKEAALLGWGALHLTPAAPYCLAGDALFITGCGGKSPTAPLPTGAGPFEEVACYDDVADDLGSAGLASLLCAGTFDLGETEFCYNIVGSGSNPALAPADAALLCSGSYAGESTTDCYFQTPSDLGATDSALLCSGYSSVDSNGASHLPESPSECYACTSTAMSYADSALLCSGASPAGGGCSGQEPVNCYDVATTALGERDAALLCSGNRDRSLTPIDCYNDDRIASVGVTESALLCSGARPGSWDGVIDCFQNAPGSDFQRALLCSGAPADDDRRPIRCFDAAPGSSDRAKLCSVNGELGAYALPSAPAAAAKARAAQKSKISKLTRVGHRAKGPARSHKVRPPLTTVRSPRSTPRMRPPR